MGVYFVFCTFYYEEHSATELVKGIGRGLVLGTDAPTSTGRPPTRCTTPRTLRV